MIQNEITGQFVYLYPEQMQQLCNMIVSTLRKESKPVDDRLSQREAYRIYGAGWVQRMVLKDPSIRTRRGNLWQYSRMKLDELNSTTSRTIASPIKRRRSPNKQEKE